MPPRKNDAPLEPLDRQLVRLNELALSRNLALHAAGWGSDWQVVERGTRDRQARPLFVGSLDQVEKWLLSNA